MAKSPWISQLCVSYVCVRDLEHIKKDLYLSSSLRLSVLLKGTM